MEGRTLPGKLSLHAGKTGFLTLHMQLATVCQQLKGEKSKLEK